MSLARKKLRELIENDFDKVQEIWDDVTEKRTETKTSWGTCKNCNHRVEIRTLIERYPVKDFITILSLAAAYGVGKPPEEKQVFVDITARRLESMTDEELNAIIDGTARELPAGS